VYDGPAPLRFEFAEGDVAVTKEITFSPAGYLTAGRAAPPVSIEFSS